MRAVLSVNVLRTHVCDGENRTKLESVVLEDGAVITVLRDEFGFEISQQQCNMGPFEDSDKAIARNIEKIYEKMGWVL